MHVALNAQLLSTETSYRAAGVSKYSYSLLTALAHIASAEDNLRFTAFVPATSAQVLAEEGQLRGGVSHTPKNGPMHGVALEPTYWPVHNPLVRIAWEQLRLPHRLTRLKADLVHGLVNVLPLSGGTAGVVTVHDLTFLRMPQLLPAFKRRYLAALCRQSVYKAERVIAVSRQTADDLVHYFQVPTSKISVIHNGVDERFHPGRAQEVELFRQRHRLPARYLLYLGTLEPRKNLPLLLRAFARWKAAAGRDYQDVVLVLAGAKGWFYEEIFAEASSLHLQEQILFPGYLPEEDLPSWYRGAHAFIYPTLFEGFGLPVLEAMACGTPVICSQAQSLLEIVGDQALTHAVDDVETLSRQIENLFEQPDLHRALSTGGIKQAAKFSWKRTASETLAVYQSINH